MADARMEFILSQLYAMRNQCDALIIALNGGLLPSDEKVCAHSETENIGTFGAPKLRCLSCRTVIEPPR